jgi:hypothetical protein
VPLSRNLGTLTSWNPLGLSKPVMGLLYLFFYMKTNINLFIISRSVSLRIKYVSDRRCREIKTNIFHSVNLFRKSCLVWDNV